MDFSGVRQCQTTDANGSFHESLISQSKHMQPLAVLCAEKACAIAGLSSRLKKIPSRHLATLEKETVVKLKNVAAK